MSGDRPLPDPAHPVYGPFWAAAGAGRLELQRCASCGYVRWPPAPLCPECLADGGAWEALSGRGTVWSVAVYEHAYQAAFRAEVPYACSLVELDEGPRLVTRLVGIDPAEAGPGLRVQAVFERFEEGVTLVWFAPV